MLHQREHNISCWHPCASNPWWRGASCEEQDAHPTGDHIRCWELAYRGSSHPSLISGKKLSAVVVTWMQAGVPSCHPTSPLPSPAQSMHSGHVVSAVWPWSKGSLVTVTPNKQKETDHAVLGGCWTKAEHTLWKL